ncbi:MAG: hypothetical protein ABJG68_01680 [Crocinitomicaceae bacterium]
MKTKQLLIVTLFSLIFTSCGGGFNNFNKQKYTGLKSIPTAYQSQEKKEDKKPENPLLKVAETFESEQQVTAENPDADKIKKAIESNEPIIIKKGEDYYLVDDPLYDQFYNKLHGKFTQVDKDDLGSSWFEVEISESTPLNERTGLNIGEGVKIGEGIAKQETAQSPTSIDNKPEVVTIPKKEPFRMYFSEKNWKESTTADVMASQHGKRTRMAYGTAIILLALAVLLLILFFSVYVEFFLIIVVGAFIGAFISLITAAVNARKFTREMYYKKKKLHASFQLLKVLSWVGILLFSMVLFPIFLLLINAT